LEEGTIKVETPIYFYLRHKETHEFSFLKVTDKFVETHIGSIKSHDDIVIFLSAKHKIIAQSDNKHEVIAMMKNRYKDLQENRKEPKFLVDYFKKYPEHLV